MCFSDAIWDRDEIACDSDVSVDIIDGDERKKKILAIQMERLESSKTAHLNRYQFLETLILIAIEKYHESDCEIPMHDAVRRLIDQEVLCRFNIETREKLRNRIFYTREVNILFQANELQL